MTRYAGIGSRSTPDLILDLMAELAVSLAHMGLVLRTGHAPGADQAFERGAGAQAEVYLPWSSYEAHVPIAARYVCPQPTDEAMVMASRFHPSWSLLKLGAQKLHARNCHQILGIDLRSPVMGVVCWTPDGTLTGQDGYSGGTGQALRIASPAGIPIYNLARDEHIEWAQEIVGRDGIVEAARQLNQRIADVHNVVDCPKCLMQTGMKCRRFRRGAPVQSTDSELKHPHDERIRAAGIPLR